MNPPKEFIDYHTASPKTCKCDFEDNKLMQSGIEGKKLRCQIKSNLNYLILILIILIRLNAYSPFVPDVMLGGQGNTATVQCAKIVRLDEEACGSMVHAVDKVGPENHKIDNKIDMLLFVFLLILPLDQICKCKKNG